VIDLLQRVASKRAEERRDMLASTVISLSLDELLIVCTEVSRATAEAYARNLWIRTPEEIEACKEKIRQIQEGQPDGN
jgi:hypothetical protein